MKIDWRGVRDQRYRWRVAMSNQKFVKTAMPTSEELAERVAEAQKRAGAASVRTVMVAPHDEQAPVAPSPSSGRVAPTAPPRAAPPSAAPSAPWDAVAPAHRAPSAAAPTDTSVRARPATRPSGATVVREMYAPATTKFTQTSLGRALVVGAMFVGAASIVVIGLWIAGVFHH